MTTSSDPDVEILLAHGDLCLRVAPFGASLRGLWRETDSGAVPIITGYSGKASKVGGQGDVLIPYPGRVGNAEYSFGGKMYHLPRNDKDGPNSIHGFLRLLDWDIVTQSENAATFAVNYVHDPLAYPSSLRATVTYTLDDAGLTCRFEIKNTGDSAAPVAAGFHPYFAVIDGLIDSDLLQIPMQATLEFNDVLIPTGNVLPVDNTPLDFRAEKTIGAIQFNTCYLNPVRDADGRTRIRFSSQTKRSVMVWMDESFGYVVVYSGDPLPEPLRRRSLAIEPMTCGSDAFNHPEWGLVSLGVGESFTGAWGVSVL